MSGQSCVAVWLRSNKWAYARQQDSRRTTAEQHHAGTATSIRRRWVGPIWQLLRRFRGTKVDPNYGLSNHRIRVVSSELSTSGNLTGNHAGTTVI
jgi:hypothetical protein